MGRLDSSATREYIELSPDSDARISFRSGLLLIIDPARKGNLGGIFLNGFSLALALLTGGDESSMKLSPLARRAERSDLPVFCSC